MRTMMLAMALMGAVSTAPSEHGAQDKTDAASYTATVKIDDV